MIKLNFACFYVIDKPSGYTKPGNTSVHVRYHTNYKESRPISDLWEDSLNDADKIVISLYNEFSSHFVKVIELHPRDLSLYDSAVLRLFPLVASVSDH